MTKAALSPSEQPPKDVDRYERFVARSFYKELRENGYTAMELLTVSMELIELITEDLPERRSRARR